MKKISTIFILLLFLVGGMQPLLGQGQWIQKANYPSPQSGAKFGFSIGTKGYIGGGSNSAAFWEYDPSTAVWTQKTDFLDGVRENTASFSIGSKGYVGTGEDNNGDDTNTFFEYDSNTNTWAQKASFGGGVRRFATGLAIGTKGYIGMGVNSNGVYMNDFWEYDPGTNAWTQKATVPGGGRLNPAGFSIGSKGYVGTGDKGSLNGANDFYEYNPSSNTWIQKATVPGPSRRLAVGFSIGSKGYIGFGEGGPCGFGGCTAYYDLWSYNPTNNTWTQKANLPNVQNKLSPSFSIGIKAYIGPNFFSNSNHFYEFEDCTFLQAFSVTGTDSGVCVGGVGVPVGLSGSEATVNYQLKLAGVDVGSPVAGTGSAISFGNQNAAGTYTVIATATSATPLPPSGGGYCVTNMTGSAILTEFSTDITAAPLSATTATLTATNGDSFQWSTSETANPITVPFGTYSVNATHTASTCTATASVSYGPGEALNFDGAGDYVTLPTALPTAITGGGTATAITIEYWFKGTNTISAVRLQSGGDFIIAGYQGKHIISNDGSVGNGLDLGADATDGNWHHIAMTWEKNTVDGFKSYLDGVIVDKRTSADVNLPNVTSMFLGRNTQAANEFMNGSLDEVRIWDHARTAQQINGSMNCSSLSSQTGLHAYYKFEQGFADLDNTALTSLADSSGNVYDGTLVGFALDGTSSNFIKANSPLQNVACCTELQIFSLTGTGNINCTGGVGTPFTLSGSELDVDYQLRVDGTDIGSPVPGTGSAISLGSHTTAGEYTAVAIATSAKTPVAGGYCETLMDGDVTLSPLVTDITAVLLNPTTASLTASGGDSYLWSTSETANPITVSFGNYSVVATDNASTCTATASLTVKPGKALDFDGAGDYVSMPTALPNAITGSGNATAITIEYWFKGTNTISAVRLQDGGDFIVSPYQGKHIISTDAPTNGLAVGTDATDGNWHHVAMTWEKNTVDGFKSYLDGVLVAERTSADVNLPNITTMTLGSNTTGNGEFMNGSLDEVRIWDHVRTDAQIIESMNCSSPVGETGLIAYYTFDQGLENLDNSSITTLVDSSGNAYDGTLMGFTLDGTASNFIDEGAPTCTPPCADIFNVTGGGAYCTGGATLSVDLSGSEVGIDYQLQLDGADTGSPIAGTGNAISFPNLTTTGTYTIVASNAVAICSINMEGSVEITVANMSNAGTSACIGEAEFEVTGAGSPASIDWYEGTTLLHSYPASTGMTFASGLNGASDVFVNSVGVHILEDVKVSRYDPSTMTGTYVLHGSSGSAANQLTNPTAIHVGVFGGMHVADNDNHRIQAWQPSSSPGHQGNTRAGGNGAGSNANQLSNPTDIYADASGNMIILEQGNNRVTKWLLGAPSGTVIAGGNGAGNAANQLMSPTSFYVDASENIYIVDAGNNRVQNWASGATSGVTVAGGNGQGSSADKFDAPWGIDVDASGNIFVSDQGNHRVQKWAPGGTSGITVAGGNGNGTNLDQLSSPKGITLDGLGNLYIADDGNARVQLWDVSTEFTPTTSGSYTTVITDDSACSVTTTALSIDAAVTGLALTNMSTCESNNTNCTSDDTFTADIDIDFSDIPTSGTLEITSTSLVSSPISIAVSTLSGTSHSLTASAFKSDGTAQIPISAEFTATSCTFDVTDAGAAPASCSAPTYTVTVSSEYGCSSDGQFTYLDDFNGKPRYELYSGISIFWDGTEWLIEQYGSTNYSNTADTPYVPCTGWVDEGFCGTLTLTGCGLIDFSSSIDTITMENESACTNPNGTTSPSDDYFTADFVVDFAYAPSTGDLTLKNGANVLGTKPASELDCANTWTFTNVQLPADGADILLTAEFSPTISYTAAAQSIGSAPAHCSCTPVQEICNGIDDDCDGIVDNNILNIIFTVDDVNCKGASTGFARARVSGGTYFTPFPLNQRYQYAWSTGETLGRINMVPKGTYMVTVTEAGGCIDSATVVIAEADVLGVALSSSPNGPDFDLTLTASDGTPPYVRYWRSGTGGGWQTPNVFLVSAGLYIVKAQDNAGCQRSRFASVPVTMMRPSLYIDEGAAEAMIAKGGPTEKDYQVALQRAIQQGAVQVEGLNIWPNPASDHISISIDSGKKGSTVRVLNTFGQTVRTLHNQDMTNPLRIDTKGLAPGNYCLQVLGSDGSSSTKCFVKANR